MYIFVKKTINKIKITKYT